jgi:hypothetical protein
VGPLRNLLAVLLYLVPRKVFYGKHQRLLNRIIFYGSGCKKIDAASAPATAQT